MEFTDEHGVTCEYKELSATYDDTIYPPLSDVELVPEHQFGRCAGCIYSDPIAACQMPGDSIPLSCEGHIFVRKTGVRLCRSCAQKLGMLQQWLDSHAIDDHATAMPCDECGGENLRHPELSFTVRLLLKKENK